MGVCVCPIFLLDIIFKNFHTLGTHEFEHRFGSLIENQRIQRNKTIMNLWIPLFFMRRIVYAATLVLLPEYGVMQLVISTIITLIVFLWAVILRPFKSREANGLTILNEGTILFCFLVSFYFKDKDKPDDERMKYSYVIMFAIVMDVVINMIFLVKDMAGQMW